MDQSEAERGRSAPKDFPRRNGLWAKIWRLFGGHMNINASDSTSTPLAGLNISPAPDGVEIQSDQNERLGRSEYTDAEKESACTKLWNVYVGEAERYDRGLIESWKGDMNGMLIFSGLFSASLTAFIIESYKILQPDPEDTTVVLLTQISLQLALASGATPPDVGASPPFRPTTPALICNLLWFISLALSLTCSLLATLVEQWARDFLHKTEIHPAPVRRARIFSFLYLGLKQFRMHVVVDVIPMLLHVSLFLFFGGLIAFLLPVNVVLVYLMGGILAAFFSLYILLTVLPVVRRASPYRTPLSGALWRLKQRFDEYTGGPVQDHDCSMTEAVYDEAIKEPEERDKHAVQWTVASLTDDSELLPLVEAIPEAIYGPKGFYRVNNYLFLPLLNTSDPEHSITTRIVNLLQSCNNHSLDTALRSRRETACLKAIWALAMLPNVGPSECPLFFWFDRRSMVYPWGLQTYVGSADAAVRYSRRNTFIGRIALVEKALESRDIGLEASERGTLLTLKCFWNGSSEDDLPTQLIEPHFSALQDSLAKDVTVLSSTAISTRLDTIANTLNKLTVDPLWNTTAQIDILVDYLSNALYSGSCPYMFFATCDRLLPDHSVTIKQVQHLHFFLPLFDAIPDPSQVESMTSEPHDIDRIVSVCLKLLPFTSESDAAGVRRNSLPYIYDYLSKRRSQQAVSYVLSKSDALLLQTYIIADIGRNGHCSDELLKTIWILCRDGLRSLSRNQKNASNLCRWADDLYTIFTLLPLSTTRAIVCEQILATHEHRLACLPSNSSLDTVNATLHGIYDHPLYLAHRIRCKPVGPPILFHDVREARDALNDQLCEIRVSILGEMLSSHSPVNVPYEGPTTAGILGQCDGSLSGKSGNTFKFFEGPVRPEYQRAFAKGVRTVVQCFSTTPTDAELENTIATVLGLSFNWPWLTDAESASVLAEAIDVYLALDGPEKGIIDGGFVHSTIEHAHLLREVCSREHRRVQIITSGSSSGVYNSQGSPSYQDQAEENEETDRPSRFDVVGGKDEVSIIETKPEATTPTSPLNHPPTAGDSPFSEPSHRMSGTFTVVPNSVTDPVDGK